MTMRTIDLGTKTRSALAHRERARRSRRHARRRRPARDLDGRLRGAHAQPRRRRSPSSPTSSQHPTFPASEVEREKKRQIDMLAQQEKDPGAIAARLRGILAFGADHPYGWPAQGFTADHRGADAPAARRLPRGALEAGQLGARLRRPDLAQGRDRAGAPALRRLDRRRRRRGVDAGAEAGAGRAPLPRTTARTRRRPWSCSSCRRRSARPPTTTRS